MRSIKKRAMSFKRRAEAYLFKLYFCTPVFRTGFPDFDVIVGDSRFQHDFGLQSVQFPLEAANFFQKLFLFVVSRNIWASSGKKKRSLFLRQVSTTY